METQTDLIRRSPFWPLSCSAHNTTFLYLSCCAYLRRIIVMAETDAVSAPSPFKSDKGRKRWFPLGEIRRPLLQMLCNICSRNIHPHTCPRLSSRQPRAAAACAACCPWVLTPCYLTRQRLIYPHLQARFGFVPLKKVTLHAGVFELLGRELP